MLPGDLRRLPRGKRIVPRPLQSRTVVVNRTTSEHLRLKNAAPYAEFVGQNTPPEVDSRVVDVKWRYVGDRWQPLGPIVNSLGGKAPLEWNVATSGVIGVSRIGAAVELPEFLSYVGFPAYAYVEVRLASANATIDTNQSWGIDLDLSKFMEDGATVAPVQFVVSQTFGYFVAYVAGLLKRVALPTISVRLNAFWLGSAMGNNETLSFDAIVSPTMSDVYQPIESVVVRGTGAKPLVKAVPGGWEVISDPHLLLLEESSHFPPSTAEDWVEVESTSPPRGNCTPL